MDYPQWLVVSPLQVGVKLEAAILDVDCPHGRLRKAKTASG
jgi:hypothetical protein